VSGASVYRLFDADDRLLYVGCSGDLNKRLRDHRCKTDWFPAVARTTVEAFPTREEALAAELEAIHSEAPAHNMIGTAWEKTAQLIIRVSPEFRHRLKAHAALERMSMNEVINRAVDAVILRDLAAIRDAARRADRKGDVQ
jgi:predicted GIY-YIG superfamily endonuclease